VPELRAGIEGHGPGLGFAALGDAGRPDCELGCHAAVADRPQRSSDLSGGRHISAMGVIRPGARLWPSFTAHRRATPPAANQMPVNFGSGRNRNTISLERANRMRWITGGPDLPPELLQALEDEQLVLFCGAGVSYPVGLPTFRGLVEKVYNRLNQTMQGLESAEFENRNYDRVFGLLEKRIGASFVRHAVIETLHLDPQSALPTHKALLTLATTTNGICRLVTTNFDRGFEFAARPGTAIEAAPKLPVPKLGVWNSVVHLHGLINDRDPDGHTLILTGADFGTAYLTERWASRFVSELFRRFTVLFVGYSVEDPVIRYMMDAFAADRVLGEGVGRAYVLDGSVEAGRPGKTAVWEAKGVIPILYDSDDDHRALHVTLAKWADCHASGLLGTDNIVTEHASSKKPVKPFDDDPVVSQVLWAISEPSGHSAVVFARLDPVPPLEWLAPLEERGLFRAALSPDEGGIRAALVDPGYRSDSPSPLHPVTRALGEWLARHIDNPELLNWVMRSGCSLHPDFRDILRQQLNLGAKLSPVLKQIWGILAGEAPIVWKKAHWSWFHVHTRLLAGEWNTVLRLELLDAISPVLTLGPATLPRFFPDLPTDETKIVHYCEAGVTLRWHQHATLIREAVDRSTQRERLLADTADDLTTLLKRGMELFELIQKADRRYDSSYSDQPSISPHEQNSGLRDWTLLIELVRDSWTQLFKSDRDRARRLVERWRSIPYPVFRRLSFYAMAESDLYTAKESAIYLLEDEAWWLWSVYVNREKFRLLNAIWPVVSAEDADGIVSAILKGPPRPMFRDDLSEERFGEISQREIWLLLAKLNEWRRELPQQGMAALQSLGKLHPDWRLAEGDRNEFTIWMEGGFGEPPVEKEEEFVNLTDEALLTQLTSHPAEGRDEVAKWRRVVVEQPGRAARLLSSMAASGYWPVSLWEAALEGFAAEKRTIQEWPLFVGALLGGPNNLFESLVRQLAWALHEVAPALNLPGEGQFWQVWDQLQPFAFHEEGEAPKDPIFAALNRPAGLLTQALLDCMTGRRPRTAADLPAGIWARLTAIAEGVGRSCITARVLVATRLAWLYVINPRWVEQHLLKYFQWDRSAEAPAIWQGYLWQARITPELWLRIKPDFLAALREKQRLGEFEDQICTVFGFICIDEPDSLTMEEAKEALRSLDASRMRKNPEKSSETCDPRNVLYV
jgi:SIR2-like domain